MGDFRGVAEVEHHLYLARNHIGGPCTGTQIRYLKAGCREEVVASIPVLVDERIQGGHRLVDRVAR